MGEDKKKGLTEYGNNHENVVFLISFKKEHLAKKVLLLLYCK